MDNLMAVCRINVMSTFWSEEMFLTLKAQTRRKTRSQLHSH